MLAPTKQVVLTNTKIQLNAMLTEGMLDPGYFTEATQAHTPTIAGVRDVPVEITGGHIRSTYEEADIQITQHTISLSLLGKSVRVVCGDTEVFVLLIHYYNSWCNCSNGAPDDHVITSEGTSSDRYSCHGGITQ